MLGTILTSLLSLGTATLAAPTVDLSLSSRVTTAVLTNLRVEGATHTFYEGPILTYGHNVTTPSGGTHHCDGTNNNANPQAGPTCTAALSDASKLARFSFDGTYSSTFDDFFITSIGDSPQTSTQFWGLLLNYQFTPVGGCQQEVTAKDEILWAFDAFNKSYFLKLKAASLVAKVGTPVTFTVSDGTTGATISGATVRVVGGATSGTTDSNGKVTLTFASKGIKVVKASRDDSIRSNGQVVVVE